MTNFRFDNTLTIEKEEEMNFKAGDRVKIVGRYNGVYGTIELVDERDEILLYFVITDKEVDGKCYCWATENDLKVINEPEEKEKMDKGSTQEWKIVITSAGEKTTARLYMLGRVVREATVTRYYKDRYDTEVAAKEAVNKLFRSQGFTGKAMFVGENTDDNGFTRGKIYQFTDGQCIDDDNDVRPYDYATTLNGNDWYSSVFIKVVE